MGGNSSMFRMCFCCNSWSTSCIHLWEQYTLTPRLCGMFFFFCQDIGEALKYHVCIPIQNWPISSHIFAGFEHEASNIALEQQTCFNGIAWHTITISWARINLYSRQVNLWGKWTQSWWWSYPSCLHLAHRFTKNSNIARLYNTLIILRGVRDGCEISVTTGIRNPGIPSIGTGLTNHIIRGSAARWPRPRIKRNASRRSVLVN